MEGTLPHPLIQEAGSYSLNPELLCMSYGTLGNFLKFSKPEILI